MEARSVSGARVERIAGDGRCLSRGRAGGVGELKAEPRVRPEQLKGALVQGRGDSGVWGGTLPLEAFL